MSDLRPRSIVIYRRGPGWADGEKLRDQVGLLEHGTFLARLEQTGRAVHAGPLHHLDDVPITDPIGIASFPCEISEISSILAGDPALISGLLVYDGYPWHVADA